MSDYYEFKIEIFPANEKYAMEDWMNNLGQKGFRMASIETFTFNEKVLTRCVMTLSSSSKTDTESSTNANFGFRRVKPLSDSEGEKNFPF